VYLIEANKNATIFIGSSNLTVDGLESGGELNLMLSLPKGLHSVRRLKEVLHTRWEEGKRLNSKQIDLYERFRPAVSTPTLRRSKLKAILGSGPPHKRADRENDQIPYWRDAIDDMGHAKTDSIVCLETDWDKKGYWWNSEPGPHPYKRGHQIFLFDIDDRLKLVTVMDTAETSVATPDGKRFLAWKPVPGHSKRLTKKLWGELRSEGILKKNANRRQKVSLEKATRLKLLLKTGNRR
jgi:hypothetical protein